MAKKNRKDKKVENQNQSQPQEELKNQIPEAPDIDQEIEEIDDQNSETENQEDSDEKENSNTEAANENQENPKTDFKDLEIKKLKELLSEQEVKNRTLQEELIDWKEKSGRIYAEMQAITKQHNLEIAQAKKSAKKNLASGLLEFLNTLQISFAFIPQTEDEKVNKFIQTLNSSYQKLTNDLTAQGINMIIPKTGDEFNPEKMDVLEGTAGADENSHTIKHVVGIGLEVDGQVIKPAIVMLG